jgi:hypothetical protein
MRVGGLRRLIVPPELVRARSKPLPRPLRPLLPQLPLLLLSPAVPAACNGHVRARLLPCCKQEGTTAATSLTC